MAFQVYRSTDSGAPIMYGTTGSLLVLLDACLVNGYGSQPGAGWTKPFPNTGSFTPAAVGYGCYQQPTGSQFYLMINDGAANGTSLYREAWATGWEVLLGVSGSVTNTVGSGSGQFPTPAQLLTNGHVVIRKSNTSDSSSARPWIVAADSSSFYLFIQTGDVANTYYGFGFGDVYSFKSGSDDGYNCVILGRNLENSSAAGNDGFDLLSALNTAVVGCFCPRAYTGLGTSITVGKHGDGVKGSTTVFLGSVPYPNPNDTAFYISPVWTVDSATSTIRGMLRGLYQPLHAIANFMDGQVFSGSADYNGKTFMAIKQTPGAGIYILETSDTLLTN